MPLQLVIGPANAEKARVALDAYRAALAAGREPVLVVPTFPDVDVYRRELAASGAVFGVQVVQFHWLLREIARRAGVSGRPLGPLARERVAAV
ncbi:MAG: ATP-dependent nuclease subunit B-like protein, partial [Solirubrobacteraceae bacterium]|nr:ATP-dependent nuclease subunit B-like protein [Solirubrobacteraceae bacterium]